jgi:lipid II:glycine glycyltransferase (peptidoglycan interpeptide bridge formation enzyme)
MRELGTPCYPRRLFESILEAFPDKAIVVVVRLKDQTVGGGFFYGFNGLAQCRWAATDVNYNRLAPNMLLYWAAIRHYCRRGESFFDFGRSTYESTQYEFKRRWGAEPVRLYYQHWMPPGASSSLVRPSDPKYRRKVEMWKKMPLWATRLVGPHISRCLP